MNNESRKNLKVKILRSVESYRRQQRIRKLLLLAAFTMLGMTTIFYFQDHSKSIPTTSISEYVESQEIDVNATSKTRLIASENEEMIIDGKQAKFEFSENGGLILNGNESEKRPGVLDNQIQYNTIVVPYGEKSEVLLPDGSIVWLNSGSKFTFPVNFSFDKREVHLIGEAIFDVNHDQGSSPFYVHTKDYRIEVLGTVFNVEAYPDDVYSRTSLKNGHITLSYNDINHGRVKRISLKQGEAITYQSKTGELSKNQSNIWQDFSWQKGKLSLRGKELDYILSKLSRHYGVERMENQNILLKGKTFSGTLNIENDLISVLDILSASSGIKFSIVAQKIQIE